MANKKIFEVTYARIPDFYLADRIIDVCNRYGKAGWEFVSQSPGIGKTNVLFFKREVREP